MLPNQNTNIRQNTASKRKPRLCVTQKFLLSLWTSEAYGKLPGHFDVTSQESEHGMPAAVGWVVTGARAPALPKEMPKA